MKAVFGKLWFGLAAYLLLTYGLVVVFLHDLLPVDGFSSFLEPHHSGEDDAYRRVVPNENVPAHCSGVVALISGLPMLLIHKLTCRFTNNNS